MRTIRLFLVLGVMLAAFSCDKDDDVLLSSFEVAKETITPSYTTVHIVCEFSTRATVKNVFVHYSKNADFSNYEELEMVEKNGKFSASLSALQRNTTYYIRYAAKNSYSSAVTKKVSQAKTLYTVATVTTTAATDVSYTTATVGGNVTSDGGASVTERGVCYSTAQNPTTSSNKISSGSGTGSFSVSLTGLSDGTTYYARAYAINSKGTSYGEQVSFTTPLNASKYVDLGLSVKWATCNVGATTPEAYGNYYAWGETEPKTTYDWSTYKWCNGSESTLTKYNTSSSNGTVDGKTVLEPEDDAATVNWGGAWRMPTDAEWTELRNNCTWTWTNNYNGTGVKGRIVTSNINGNIIFLPAAGHGGSYWSSSLYTDSPDRAWDMSFTSYYVDGYAGSRYCDLSVRPVLK